MLPPPPRSTLFPYTTLFRSFRRTLRRRRGARHHPPRETRREGDRRGEPQDRLGNLHLHELEDPRRGAVVKDRKSTRLNSSHGYISYAVFCLKKKKKKKNKTK